jgi:hypothetical protein
MNILHRCQTVLSTASLLVFLCAPAWAKSETAGQALTPASSSCNQIADSATATPTKEASNASGTSTNSNLQNQDTLKSPAVRQPQPVVSSFSLPSAATLASSLSCIGTSMICLPEGTQHCCGTLRCRLPNGKPPYRCLP